MSSAQGPTEDKRDADRCRHRTSALKELSGSDVCYTFGFGSGLLASAAVTCHPDPRELVAVGLQMVRIAFRVGLLATEMKSQVSPDLTSNAPWRVNVATTKDLTPEAIEGLLERFAAEKVRQQPTWLACLVLT